MARKKTQKGEGKYAVPLIDDNGLARPPHTPEAEQAVLGAMMYEREAVRMVVATLKPTDFFSPQHGVLFDAMVELQAREEPVDPVTVAAALGPDRLASCGGMDYLMSLTEAAPTPQACRTYARTVGEDAIKRRQMLAWGSYAQRPDEERRLHLIDQLEASSDGTMEFVEGDNLLRKDIKVEWLVYPLVPLRSVTILLGDWHIGKSWMGLSLCHALSIGADTWLGTYKIERKGGALYVDAEMGDASMKGRLEALEEGAGIPLPERQNVWDTEEERLEADQTRPIDFLFFPGWHLGSSIGRLESRIRERKHRLVVIDSVFAMADPGMDIYHPEFWFKILPPARRLADKCFCSVILCHHLSKPSEVRRTLAQRAFGSVAAMAGVDNVIGVSGDQKGGPKIVTHEKFRLVQRPEPDFYLEFSGGENGKGLVLLRGEDVPDREAEGQDYARSLILELLADGGEHRTKEVQEHVASESEAEKKPARATVTRTLKEMVEKGEILKPKLGVYSLKPEEKEPNPWDVGSR